MMKKYEFKEVEREIFKFWDKNDIYPKARLKNQGKKKFYYLDGPPYTSGKVHLGTAWSKVLRDSFLRYKRMAGFDVWDRAGFDMHGLPTENSVTRKLGLKTKEEIEKYGIAKFQNQCKKFCLDNMDGMIKDFENLGVWMNFEDPYMSITPEFTESVWWLIKQAHEKGRLYEGKKSMQWCSHCATSLAKHELEYKNITDTSIFLKFRLKDKKDQYLIIWTTTPWTIPFNLAVMVNPDLEYVKAKVGKDVWVIAKALVGVFMNSVVQKKFEILDEFSGKALSGMKYEHPFYNDIHYYKEIEAINPRVHTVVMSHEYVDTSAGTGLVHCAPGCGPEDFEIGKREELPAYNELDEQGIFKKSMGKFAGLQARKEDHKFIEYLRETGSLIATSDVDHDYAHCWRCHKGVVFRTTDQWFFKVEDLKEKMIELNNKVKWVPKAAYNAFDAWLKNLKDNSITRQRYWGTPVPIWKCDKCKKYDVIGSFEELKDKAGKLPEDYHKPWIDKIEYKCDCGGMKKRLPDILDVWIDAGTVSWSCLGYPQQNNMFNDLYPADFILEGKDQIRGWFNLLLICSMLAFEKHPYKAVYMHGFINDSQGRKMSKSEQNYILPSEVLDKYGVDTFRYYMLGAANPGTDMNYNFEDVQLKNKNLLIIWNLHNFIFDLSKVVGINPTLIKEKAVEDGLEEKYILSRLHSTIKKVTSAFEEYRINDTPWLVEKLYMDLSRTYIQLVREKVALGTDKQKQAVLRTVFDVFIQLLKLMSPIIPLLTEKMYQNLRKEFELDDLSIHLMGWPKHNPKFVNTRLEKDMEITQDIISNVLSMREKSQLGLRWPVQEVIIDTKNEEVLKAAKRLKLMLKQQVNTKTLLFKHLETGISVKPNYKLMGIHFGSRTTEIVDLIARYDEKIIKALQNDEEKIKIGDVTIEKEFLEISRELPEGYSAIEFKHGTIYMMSKLTASLEAEGYAREIVRRIQQLRKEAGLVKNDKIDLLLIPSEILLGAVEEWKDTIKEKTGCKKIKISTQSEGNYANFASHKIKGNGIEIFLKKI